MICFLFLYLPGYLSGLDLGIIFRFGGTTGGVDIIARLVKNILAGVWEKRCSCSMHCHFSFLGHIFRYYAP